MFAQNTLSSKGLVTIGFPQGSLWDFCCSPYTYINDLSNSIGTCDINMYADDTELHYCYSQLQRVKQVLQNEVE